MVASSSSEHKPASKAGADKSSVVVQVDFRQRRSLWLRHWPKVLVGSLLLVMLTLAVLYTLTVNRQYTLQTLTHDNRQLVENNRQLESRLLHGQSFHQLNAELGQAPHLLPAGEKLLVKFPKAVCHLSTRHGDHLTPTETLALRRVYGY